MTLTPCTNWTHQLGDTVLAHMQTNTHMHWTNSQILNPFLCNILSQNEHIIIIQNKHKKIEVEKSNNCTTVVSAH